MRQRLYEAQSLKCQDNVHSSQQEFDKAVLTLSAGLLGLSLGFVKDVVPLNQAVALPLLYLSWCCSGIAILLTLLSFMASKNAFNAQLGELYKEYCGADHVAKPTRAALVTRWLTYGEGAFFVAAVALTVAFAIVNIQSSRAVLGGKSGRSLTEVSDHFVQPGQEKGGAEPAKVIQEPSPNPAEQRPPAQTRGDKLKGTGK